MRRLLGPVSAAILLASCASDGRDAGSVDPTVPGAATASAFPTTVEHALGSTTIDERPERVVALDLSVVDAVLALDVELVGYTTFSDPEGPLPEHFGTAIDDHASAATWVGDLTSPSLEQIALLEPDLIVTAAVRHESVYDELAAVAPTVATDSAGGGWKDSLRLVAEATGTSGRAEQLIATYEARAERVGAAINDAAADPTISVVRFVDAIRMYQPTSFSGTVLADAGLARPPTQQDTDDFVTIISEEEIGMADADVLLYTVYDNEDIESYVTGLHDRPLWTTLGAVQRGDAHAVPDSTWMSGVGIFGAHEILDDLAAIFGTDPVSPDPQEQP